MRCVTLIAYLFHGGAFIISYEKISSSQCEYWVIFHLKLFLKISILQKSFWHTLPGACEKQLYNDVAIRKLFHLTSTKPNSVEVNLEILKR